MLVITHNLMAMNAERQFNISTKKKEKSSEKLASGYRINRAADDAAGLSISEKMRRQIRGLRQGCDNVDDGISLIKTADGALSEISSILQRMNELSVQAYNDTYNREDREAMQAEVEQLMEEIERTVDTTQFNGIKILQGNRLVKKTYNSTYDGTFTTTASMNVPDWLKVDDKMEYHAVYDHLSQVGDSTAYMFQPAFMDSNGIITDARYFGPKELTREEFIDLGYADFADSYQGKYAGTWTDDLGNNATVGIDFSELTNVTDANTLYSNLLSLMGTGISIPCGSCDYNYGIVFGGKVEDTRYEPQYVLDDTERKRLNKIDLSEIKSFTDDLGSPINCFEAVNNLINKHLSDNSKTDAEKQSEVKVLATDIAKMLATNVYENMKKNTDKVGHFDRVIKNGDYSIVVYDFRDKNTGADVEANVLTETVTQVTSLAKNLTREIRVTEEEGLHIQHGANTGEDIQIHLASGYGILALLNSQGHYNISQYYLRPHYSQNYMKELEQWEADCVYQTVEKTENYTRTIPGKMTVTYVPASADKNGEITPGHHQITQEASKVEIYTKTWKEQELINKYGLPKPTPSHSDIIWDYEYHPSSNKQIEDALKYLNKCRSQLGATQNRLEYIFENNQNYHENLTSAESNIRDTDVVKEMIDYSKHNILEQVGQSMIAQANQQHNSVLNLLQ